MRWHSVLSSSVGAGAGEEKSSGVAASAMSMWWRTGEASPMAGGREEKDSVRSRARACAAAVARSSCLYRRVSLVSDLREKQARCTPRFSPDMQALRPAKEG